MWFVSFVVAECLKFSLVNCDGGEKDDQHRADAMITNLPGTSSSEKEGEGRKTERERGWGGGREREREREEEEEEEKKQV